MRSKFLLILAVIMGAVTTYLFYHYMTTIDQSASGHISNTVKVVVAKQPIKKNQLISNGMIELVDKPVEGVHPDAVRDLSKVVGLYATTDIVKGEVLLSPHLKKSSDEATFVSRKIENKDRGVSIGVNFVQSVSNLIEPEDHVDVVFTQKVQNGAQVKMVTEKLLDNVRVLAVGMRLLPDSEQSATTSSGNQQSGQNAQYTSVTLELNPTDSVKLINASERGNIQLILHSSLVPSK